MTESWNRVKELFNSALERNVRERNEFLRQACGEDESLRVEVESLLSNYDSVESCLDGRPAAKLLIPSSGTMEGRQIGSYRIIRECGHGGMAVVYLAERADQQYKKRVAIKMVLPGINSDEILRRFRNERQTLAALDHLHIVKLLDGGSTEEGLPYLVMDYVEGVPIDEYSDRHTLSVLQRLELFRTVCGAVHYAHENQVIHRDLKPSNILVTAEGVPRLLDFGIAKLLNAERFDQTTLATRTGLHAMTPEYASPEQVRGEAVTRASDIYSLGVLLYKLLTGHSPYQTKSDSLIEIQRLICDEEPTKPSTVVSQTELRPSGGGQSCVSITPQTVSSVRKCRPEELRRWLYGDLDAIVLKALRKEPELRYESVEELSADIGRHLSGMPVHVRKPTLRYRSAKFLRRHREAVCAATIVLTLMGGITGWQAYRVRNQRGARNPSESVPSAGSQARPTVAVLGFKNLSNRSDTAWLSTAFSEMLSTELATGEKLRTVPGETVARAKLDLSLSEVDSLAPDTLARVRKDLGADFVVLGSYFDQGKDAGDQIRLDIRLQDALRGETVGFVSETGTESKLLELVTQSGSQLREKLGLEEVSAADSARMQASMPSNSDSLRLYSQGLAKLRSFDALAARDLFAHAVALDPTFPLAHSGLANAWMNLGYDAKAQHEAKKALDTAGKLSPTEHLLVEGHYYEAIKDWGKAIETYRTLYSSFPDDLDYGLYLANAQISAGKGKDAFVTIEELRHLRGQQGVDSRIDLVESLAASSLSDNVRRRDAAERAANKASAAGANLLVAEARVSECRAMANLGQAQEARAACDEARQIYESVGDAAGMARTLHATAEAPLNQGNFQEAMNLYEEALSLARKVGDKRGIARELTNVGVVLAQLGDSAAAEKVDRDALYNYREVGYKLGVAGETSNLAELLYLQGKLVESLGLYKESLALAREWGDKDLEALDVGGIGNVMAEQGDLSGAMQMYQQALALQQEIGEQHYSAGWVLAQGHVLRQRGDLAGAKKNYDQALSVEKRLGEKGSVAETQLALLELACDTGQTADADTLASAAIQQFQSVRDSKNEMLTEAAWSKSLLPQGKLEDARKAMDRALALSKESQHVLARLSTEIASASVRAAAGDVDSAEQIARQALSNAKNRRLARLELEASLALGEIQLKGRTPAAGRSRLIALEKASRAKGFELIAQKAARARMTKAGGR
jgi:eukaryotic-like serine/threonine-protein kinase